MMTNTQLAEPFENLADALEQLVAVAINNRDDFDPRVIVANIRDLGDPATAHAEVETWDEETADEYEVAATHMLIDATDEEIAAALAELSQPVG